jgi:hypothetical protein
MSKPHDYTPEKLGGWETSKLQTLRENAVRRGVSDLVEMCDRELANRKPRVQRLEQADHSAGSFVAEYHFVCAKDRGVLSNGPGKFWSGSWVVAEANVRKSIEYGALLALHESKAERSYRQGRILEYRRSSREMVDKDNEGIEFLIEEAAASLAWEGAGSGEKGYKWEEVRRPIPKEEK